MKIKKNTWKVNWKNIMILSFLNVLITFIIAILYKEVSFYAVAFASIIFPLIGLLLSFKVPDILIKAVLYYERSKAAKRIKRNRIIRDIYFNNTGNAEIKKDCINQIYGVEKMIISDRLFNNYCEVSFTSGICLLSDFHFFKDDIFSDKFFNEIIAYSNNLIKVELYIKPTKYKTDNLIEFLIDQKRKDYE